ncbi:carboxypeptidase regulatory-like domain-containing protein, partial [Pseudonocardia sp. KRD-184]
RPFTAPRLTAVPSLQKRREGGAHRLIEPADTAPPAAVVAESAELAPVADAQPVVEAEPQTALVAEAGSRSEAVTATESEPVIESELVIEPTAAADPEPVSEPAAATEPEPVAEPAAISGDAEQPAVPEPAPAADAAAVTEQVAAVEPVADEPAAEVEPAVQPAGATAAPTADESSTSTVPKVAAATAAVAGTAVAASLLSRRWDEDPDRTGPIPTAAAAENGFPEADPDVLFDSPSPATTESAEPDAAAPETAPEAAAEPEPELETVAAVIDLPSRRTPRDPGHVAAEQAAADLALLRTFGDPSARPERAPVVALEGAARPEAPPAVGAAQPVRFRAVRHDGTEVASAAVALLDDRGREVACARTATGELTAPHPGAFVLVATAPDHQPGAVAVAVGDAPSDVEVQLVRSAALVGTVLGEDGPITGARVTLVQDGEVVEVAETDSDGAYLIADLAAGEYAVSVAAAGCEADVVLVVVAEEAECVHDVELAPAGVRAG